MKRFRVVSESALNYESWKATAIPITASG
jgi:hypothetical protein